MEALNAAGRRISLLNDDGPRHATPSSGASSPTSSQPWRSGSCDSLMSDPDPDAVSPLTPALDYTYPGSQPPSSNTTKRRPLHYASSRSTSNEDEVPVAHHHHRHHHQQQQHHSQHQQQQQDRPAKRYPCRFRDSHGCDKTFTTSGHASRHSKIHTAEKAVQCTFAGCHKKFTRADNMKQHLETHYKDKSRGGAAAAAATATNGGKSTATAASSAHERRPTLSTARSRSSSSSVGSQQHEMDARQYALPTPPPLHSPSSFATGRSGWEIRGVARPAMVHAPRSGLDALAMAVACQER